MTAEAGGGHYMSSFSSVEILVSLYFSELHFNVNNLEDPDRDRFVLSKGHAAPALYAVMADVDEYQCAVIFLVSDASSYMTGSIMSIDGGRTCW